MKGFNEHFKRGYSWSLEGRDTAGAFLRVRSWVFRSEAYKVHFQVTVRDLSGDVPKDEEELTFVLESIRDVGKK